MKKRVEVQDLEQGSKEGSRHEKYMPSVRSVTQGAKGILVFSTACLSPHMCLDSFAWHTFLRTAKLPSLIDSSSSSFFSFNPSLHLVACQAPHIRPHLPVQWITHMFVSWVPMVVSKDSFQILLFLCRLANWASPISPPPCRVTLAIPDFQPR